MIVRLQLQIKTYKIHFLREFYRLKNNKSPDFIDLYNPSNLDDEIAITIQKKFEIIYNPPKENLKGINKYINYYKRKWNKITSINSNYTIKMNK